MSSARFIKHANMMDYFIHIEDLEENLNESVRSNESQETKSMTNSNSLMSLVNQSKESVERFTKR